MDTNKEKITQLKIIRLNNYIQIKNSCFIEIKIINSSNIVIESCISEKISLVRSRNIIVTENSTMIIKNSFTRLSKIENNRVSQYGFNRMVTNFQEKFIEKWRIIGIFIFALFLLGAYYIGGVFHSLYFYFTKIAHTIEENINFYGNIAYISLDIITFMLGFYFLSAKQKAEKIPLDNYENNISIDNSIINDEINHFFQAT